MEGTEISNSLIRVSSPGNQSPQQVTYGFSKSHLINITKEIARGPGALARNRKEDQISISHEKSQNHKVC